MGCFGSKSSVIRIERGKMYYYIVTMNEKGKTVVIGPYANDDKAHMDSLNSQYESEIVPLDTKNLSRATQMVKGMKFQELGDVNRATDRTRHSVGDRNGKFIHSNGNAENDSVTKENIDLQDISGDSFNISSGIESRIEQRIGALKI